jgi:hypothetical protein
MGWNFANPVGLRTFSVEDEFSRASIVAAVKVVSARKLFEDLDEPDYATATEYKVKPLETLKGPVLPEIALYSPTTWRSSIHFNMGVTRTYIVFVTSVGGVYTIDTCGWSDELVPAADTLKQVRALAAPEKHG